MNLDAYMARDYAPVAERADAIVRTCEALGPFLEQGQANLEPAMPRTLLETAQLITDGQVQFVDEGVLPAMEGLADEHRPRSRPVWRRVAPRWRGTRRSWRVAWPTPPTTSHWARRRTCGCWPTTRGW